MCSSFTNLILFLIVFGHFVSSHKGRKETEEIVEEMKVRDRKEEQE